MKTLQLSEEVYFYKRSLHVTVTTQDTKAAVSLQASLQARYCNHYFDLDCRIVKKLKKVNLPTPTAKIKQVTYQKQSLKILKNVDVTTLTRK
ncbi:spore coat protein [Anaerobacillus sp. HL2]|nr:spore coat protein [Anaerobacillus sp. HL2]